MDDLAVASKQSPCVSGPLLAGAKQRRANMGYEKSPPRCSNCADYVRQVRAIPGVRKYADPWCQTGRFVVDPGGICDRWKGIDGAALETTTPPGGGAEAATKPRVTSRATPSADFTRQDAALRGLTQSSEELGGY